MLDFDLRAESRSTPVKQILAGKTFNRPLGGMVGVAGVGQEAWMGAPLANANLYAFGRLAWNPNLTAQQIAEEWTRQTIGSDPVVVSTVTKMLMQSWPAYVDYTGPLGMQTLTDITGSHYGPNIEAARTTAGGNGIGRTTWAWAWTGRCHGHGIRGAVLAGGGEGLRERLHHAGQFADVLPSRSVHVETA